jgi:hypothetical protein
VIRLVAIGAAAQIPYMAALDDPGINVIGTFLAVLGTLFLMDNIHHPAAKAAVFAASAAVLELVPFSYGAYALVLVFIYRTLAARPHAMTGAHFALNLAYALWTGADLQLFSLLPTLLIAYEPRMAAKRTAPRWLWWSFYPAHLAVLAVFQAVRLLPSLI